MRRTWVAISVLTLACSAGEGPIDAASTPVDGNTRDAGVDALVIDASTIDAARAIDAASTPDAGPIDPRDRLLATYLAFLRTTPMTAQSNGLRGADLSSVCDLWSSLDPSSQATYLTLTARLAGSELLDGTAALDHVVALHRVSGGQSATATDAGSCGGGEYNRMIVSIDMTLHDALVATNDHHGGSPHDLTDIPSGDAWRDSHDAAGPHTPFDESDETNDGAPRGQVQFFHDPASAAAHAPLGRLDLETLVDPQAMEMDQDYDCVHNSNPLCSYVTYGPLCFPQASKTGVEVYEATYGAIDLGWRPSGCS